MQTHKLTALFIGVLLASCSSTKTTTNNLAPIIPITTTINLTKVKNDKVPVTINPGRFVKETVTFRLPRIVQGTYAVGDFGKYIDDFKAIDYSGNELQVTKEDTNTWIIDNGKELDKISYWVNDTYDMEVRGGIGFDVPFSPAGTNIEPDNYVLNLHGFIGYFDSLKNNQYTLDVTAPIEFVRTSALQNIKEETSEDGKSITTSYFAPRYFDITDNPMMYGKLDVEEFQVGDIKIVLSVYSPNKTHSAKSLKDTFYKMMQAQKTYLGDINSTSRYDIYVYLSEMKEDSPKGFGALEHHTSTVVVMPERSPAQRLAKSMLDIVSHEFFHILTPLTVHSEDVHYFDYNQSTFSKHLWMYEGVTEYFSILFQINQDLVLEDEFYKSITNQIRRASGMDDTMSFTVMSENVLEQPYASNYLNVYQKGSLIGMCIDILIREGSDGNRGILSLMKELSLKYGKNKPFEDDKIIDEIVAMTYPSLRSFFDNHVIGTTPINYNDFFEKVGLELAESKVETNYAMSSGTMIFGANREEGYFFFKSNVSKNSFWNEQGVLPNDIIKSVNGTEVMLNNSRQIMGQMFRWRPGNEIEVVLNRNGEEIVIKATLTQSYTTSQSLQNNPNATDAQIALRKAWLKG